VEISAENYCVARDENINTISFKGSLRLSGMEEYEPIINLLDGLANQDPEQIILDLTGLEFLNSSGISMLSKFVINIRKKNSTQIIVQGSGAIPWQGKSLKNLQRLMPSLILEFN
jgi:hypothetical protein